MSYADQIKSLALPTVPTAQAEFPRIGWRNGVKAAKMPGFFYAKAGDFPDGLGAPWQAERVYDNEDGYKALELRIAPIASRVQPFKDERDPVTNRTIQGSRQWFTKWERGMQLYTEILCLMEGYSGPVVFYSDGLTGKAVGIALRTYQNGLLQEAARVAGQGLPMWAFWLPIASKLQNDGKPAYEDTGYGPFVTPPTLHLPENPLDTLFVGPDVMEQATAIYQQHVKWATTLRLPNNTVEGEIVSIVNTPRQIAAPRTVPQPLSADEEF